MLANAVDGRRSPEDAMIDGETRRHVRNAMSKLSRRERGAILLMAAGEITTTRESD
jgi:DNA-directed RNA polymerase specialized sigma24 family protein